MKFTIHFSLFLLRNENFEHFIKGVAVYFVIIHNVVWRELERNAKQKSILIPKQIHQFAMFKFVAMTKLYNLVNRFVLITSFAVDIITRFNYTRSRSIVLVWPLLHKYKGVSAGEM